MAFLYGNIATCKRYLIIRDIKEKKKVIATGQLKQRFYLHRQVPAW